MQCCNGCERGSCAGDDCSSPCGTWRSVEDGRAAASAPPGQVRKKSRVSSVQFAPCPPLAWSWPCSWGLGPPGCLALGSAFCTPRLQAAFSFYMHPRPFLTRQEKGGRISKVPACWLKDGISGAGMHNGGKPEFASPGHVGVGNELGVSGDRMGGGTVVWRAGGAARDGLEEGWDGWQPSLPPPHLPLSFTKTVKVRCLPSF